MHMHCCPCGEVWEHNEKDAWASADKHTCPSCKIELECWVPLRENEFIAWWF